MKSWWRIHWVGFDHRAIRYWRIVMGHRMNP